MSKDAIDMRDDVCAGKGNGLDMLNHNSYIVVFHSINHKKSTDCK